MTTKTAYPTEVEHELKSLALNIKTARVRRKLALKALAVAAKTSVSTLIRIEAADPTVAIGTVLQVLGVLNLVRGVSETTKPENDLAQVLEEVRNLRLNRSGKRASKIGKEELNF